MEPVLTGSAVVHAYNFPTFYPLPGLHTFCWDTTSIVNNSYLPLVIAIIENHCLLEVLIKFTIKHTLKLAGFSGSF